MGNFISTPRGPRARHDSQTTRHDDQSGSSRTHRHAPQQSTVTALLSGLAQRSKSSKDASNRSRPDLSNIEHIDRTLAQSKTKDALIPFLNSPYSMQQELERTNVAADPDATKGFCFGLALEWLDLRARGTSNTSAIDSLRTPEAVQRAVDFQARYVETHRQTQSLEQDPNVRNAASVQRMFTESGLRFQALPSVFSGAHVSSHVRSPGNYILALTGFRTGHAVMVSTPRRLSRDQRRTIFDPNMGEFKVASRDMEYFLDALDARYSILGSKFTSATVYSFSESSNQRNVLQNDRRD
jgi:hypothetical protein